MNTPIRLISDTAQQNTEGYQSTTAPSQKELRLASSINALMRDLEAMSKDAHEQVYSHLRQTMSASQFVTDYSGTHFSTKNVTDAQLTELYNAVALCRADEDRLSVINTAEVDARTAFREPPS
jgi:hypothetical protein